MKMFFLIILCASFLQFCTDRKTGPSFSTIQELDLKRGDLISCGPADKQFGNVDFINSCNEDVKSDFNLGIKLLHSFEYDEAEKVFARIVDRQPDCAMAYWGIAMSNFHALWTAPTEPELIKGVKAIKIARSLKDKTGKESEYIESIAAYFINWQKNDHKARALNFEKAMASLSSKFPDDKEASILYALALNAAADPADKTFQKQHKAGQILDSIYTSDPGHPGIVHYIIHTYDYPGMAEQGLAAARKYASVAPSSAHALHMPSHVFTRLGLWDESIRSNIASVESAKCYAESAGFKGHWDEELHGLDYLVYAYLQKGDNKAALRQLDYLNTIKEVYPENFKVAYAFASIPSRYVLENRDWKAAATLNAGPPGFSWKKYPWQKAIIHFTRAMGKAQTGQLDSARLELAILNTLTEELLGQKDTYKANQVEIQAKTAEAWIKFKSGKINEGINLMKQAADLEAKTGKHPVTPGEVLPARELLADMLRENNQLKESLEQYELVLNKTPNRFNALTSAAGLSKKMGNRILTDKYYKQLNHFLFAGSEREEAYEARKFLADAELR